MTQKSHWDDVYNSKSAEEVSWFQKHPAISLQLIEQSDISFSDAVIDVGGGASTLVDDLLSRGYANLTVLDISGKALEAARLRLGSNAGKIEWIIGDITDITLPENNYSLWHDRAVFHFLLSPEDRNSYIECLTNSVIPGGNVIIATFAEDGPGKCSGLPVRRYSLLELQKELGPNFHLQQHIRESHRTPTGAIQHFNYCRFLMYK